MATANVGPSSSSDSRAATPSKRTRTGSTRNPVALRLYKVLSSTHDDPATAEALRTLSVLYGAPEGTKGKTPMKTDATTEDIDFDGISGQAGLAARARKSLRRDAEVRLSKGTQQFLRAFQRVDKVCFDLRNLSDL